MFSLFDGPDTCANAQRPLPGPPPDGMIAGEVTLYFKYDAPLVVPAYQVGAIAVHRAAAAPERWGVSHAGTGPLIREFDDRAAAVDCARKAAGALDWLQLRMGGTPETHPGFRGAGSGVRRPVRRLRRQEEFSLLRVLWTN